jgi:Root hair defective 3 GTP-binding protein (RHD3)
LDVEGGDLSGPIGNALQGRAVPRAVPLPKQALSVAWQAISTQEANRAASNRMPPLWAALAIAILGWNEFVAMLYNPLLLIVIFLVFLFGKVGPVGGGCSPWSSIQIGCK